MRAVVLLLLLAAAASPAADKPMLVLNPRGHADGIPGLAFTPDGKSLLSVSKDKTLRIWDLKSGDLEATLRVPIGPGRDGSLYALAVSPDGKTVAVGGFTPHGKGHRLYLIDYPARRIAGTLDGHEKPVSFAAFSPDGARLVSTSEDRTARVWDVRKRSALRVLSGHEEAVYGAAWSPDGKSLLTAGWDGTARLWDSRTGEERKVLRHVEKAGYPVLSAAWSPDGRRLATGCWDETIRFWSPDGELLQRTARLKDGVRHLAFSPDSKQAYYSLGLRKSAEGGRVGVEDAKPVPLFAREMGPGWGGALSPDGKLAATGGVRGEELYVWRTSDGAVVHRLGGAPRGAFAVAWRGDSKAVAWSSARGAALSRSFDLEAMELHESAPEDAHGPFPSFVDRQLVRVPGGIEVREEDKVVSTIKLEFDQPTCWTFLRDGKVVLGSYFRLALHDPGTGKRLRSYVGHTGDLVAVAPSRDDRYFATSAADQTIRVWKPDRSEPLLSLFVAGNEWVAWSPEGYYACSPGGEALMGWHVGDGPGKLGTFHPAERFRASLYRPDLVRRLLAAGSTEKALAAGVIRGVKPIATDIGRVLPPLVVITSPDRARSVAAGEAVEIRFVARTAGEAPIKAARLLIDGKPLPHARAAKTYAAEKGREVRDGWKVKLPVGRYRLAVRAETAQSAGVSEAAELVVKEGAEEKEAAPALYVLAVGVSEYQEPSLNLEYAAKDAAALAAAFQKTGRRLFRKVEATVLADRAATRKRVLQGLAWVRKQATQRDVAVIFFAGHGARDTDGSLFLLAADTDPEDLLATGIPAEQLKRTLQGMPGRTLLVMDACHAGAVGRDRRRSAGLTDGLARDLATDDYGVAVLCSSMGREVSLESSETKHGLFTLAILEALAGKGGRSAEGAVYLHHLEGHVAERVKQLSRGRQHPVSARPTTLRSFPLSLP